MNTRQFSAADGTRLCADVYSASENSDDKAAAAKGVVVIVHGYCEHRGRYRHVAEHLARHGYDVLVGDLRGHGGSGGDRGFVWRFSDYLDDVSAFLREAAVVFRSRSARAGSDGADGAPRKPILLGHSMGGLVAMQYALAHPQALRALVLSSPFLGLKLRVPGWKRTMGLLASLIRPKLRLPNDIPASDLSHDSAVCRAYETDPLVTHEATARWFTETLSAQADTLARAVQVQVPTLMLHAGDDRIVDSTASQAVFARISAKEKSLTFYPGLYHEIFNELEKDRVLNDMMTWLAEREQRS
jgi:alpha-beta hydrolase superfamily lysophospholipase